jgi:DNA (cytosine-5)-methyltransferase 1
MAAYYNDSDPYVCQWLRNLIAAGLIAEGDVDNRSITEVRADEIRGYTQCHFFAGIGGWSLALRLAQWPDERPVWTGSCPCQPLSGAGQRKGHADQRHLWPAFHRLIAECRPAVVFGEQVGGALGLEWLAGVRADLEESGYACGCANLPACGVGAPHRRERLWFVADADGGGEQRQQPQDGGAVADTDGHGWGGWSQTGGRQTRDDDAGGRDGMEPWSGAEWLIGSDGKARRAQSGVRLLASGVQQRASKLRAYGNAIVPRVAAEFIAAFMEASPHI